MNRFTADNPNCLLTSSRFQMWWLVNFRGYMVVQRTEEPTESLLRQIRYKNHWQLATSAVIRQK